jgi:hypothetical protein
LPVAAPRTVRGPAAERRGVEPTHALLVVFVAATGLMLVGLGGKAANLTYLGLAVGTALGLLARQPALYVSFTFWLYFLTPFVRRVLDFRNGWNPTNPVLLAPPLVAGLAIFVIVRHLRELKGVLFAPYLLILVALAYGYAVGVINAGSIPATYALVTWIAPVIFGIHLAVSWRRYAEIREALSTTFRWAIPALAAYGIYQFVRLPAWDAAWMRWSDLHSIGAPLPHLVRVFGTLNTPGPFASVLAAGALLLLTQRGSWRYLSIALALVALLLTRTRAVWVAFVIGILIEQVTQPVARLPKRTATLMFVVLLALPLLSIPSFRAQIMPRLSTLGNISSDNSFLKRVQLSEQTAYDVVESAEGNGLGLTGGATKLRDNQGVRSLDNGFLELFFIFGWPGGTMFLLGMSAMILQSFRFFEARRDPFANSVRAAAVSILSMLPIGDVFTGSTGTLLWSMIGLGMAGHAYHMRTGLALRSRAPLAVRPAPPAPPARPAPSAPHVPARA